MRDQIYHGVKQLDKSKGFWTVTQMQRKFKIGYNRAVRLIEDLMADGILSSDANNHRGRKTIQA